MADIQDPTGKRRVFCPDHERFEHPEQVASERGEEEGAEMYMSAMVKAVGRVVRKQARDPFAVATSQAQEMGFTDFAEGSPGRAKRDEIAETIKGDKQLSKRPGDMDQHRLIRGSDKACK